MRKLYVLALGAALATVSNAAYAKQHHRNHGHQQYHNYLHTAYAQASVLDVIAVAARGLDFGACQIAAVPYGFTGNHDALCNRQGGSPY